MKKIIVLPTGEWAEVSASNPAVVIRLKNKQFKKLTKLSPSPAAIQELKRFDTDIKTWFKEQEA